MFVVMYLVGLDGSNLLVLLDVVANLCAVIRWGRSKMIEVSTHVLRIASGYPL